MKHASIGTFKASNGYLQRLGFLINLLPLFFLLIFVIFPTHRAIAADTQDIDAQSLHRLLFSAAREPKKPLASFRIVLSGRAVDFRCDRNNQRIILGYQKGEAASYHLATGKLIAQWQAQPRFTNIIAISPNGKVVVTSSRQGRPFTFWSSDTGEMLLQIPTLYGGSAAFSANGQCIYLGHEYLHILDTKSGRLTKTDIKPGGSFSALLATPDNKKLFGYSNGKLVLMNIAWKHGIPHLTEEYRFNKMGGHRDPLRLEYLKENNTIRLMLRNGNLHMVKMDDLHIKTSKLAGLISYHSVDFLGDQAVVTGRMTKGQDYSDNQVRLGKVAGDFKVGLSLKGANQAFSCLRSSDDLIIVLGDRMATAIRKETLE